MNKWRVRITHNTYDKLYKLSSNSNLQESYIKVKEFAMKKEQEYKEEHGVKPITRIISCSYHFKPKGAPETFGRLWCPWCNKWEIFLFDRGYDRCIGCGMTTEDFWIKKYNNLFPVDRKQRLR